MKLDENRPMRATVKTNCSGLLRRGKTEKPMPWAKNESSRILLPLPVLSKSPPQVGERRIVSSAGMKEMSAIRENEAPSDFR